MTTVSDLYDAVAEKYDRYFDTPEYQRENRYVRAIIWFAGIHPREVTSVLDVGCGTALFLELFDLRPEQYVGFDISMQMLTRAREKYPHHDFFWGDYNAPSPYRGFQLTRPWQQGSSHSHRPANAELIVSLFGSLNYMDHATTTLTRIYHTLKPGGTFLSMVYTPAYRQKSDYILNGETANVTEHYYQPEEYYLLLRSAGFQAKHISSLPIFPVKNITEAEYPWYYIFTKATKPEDV